MILFCSAFSMRSICFSQGSQPGVWTHTLQMYFMQLMQGGLILATICPFFGGGSCIGKPQWPQVAVSLS